MILGIIGILKQFLQPCQITEPQLSFPASAGQVESLWSLWLHYKMFFKCDPVVRPTYLTSNITQNPCKCFFFWKQMRSAQTLASSHRLIKCACVKYNILWSWLCRSRLLINLPTKAVQPRRFWFLPDGKIPLVSEDGDRNICRCSS